MHYTGFPLNTVCVCMCVCLQRCKAVIDAGISVQIIKIISWLPSNSLSVLKNVSARSIWCIPISQRLKHPLQCTHISISIWHHMLPLHHKCPDSACHCQGNDYFCLLYLCAVYGVREQSFFACNCARKTLHLYWWPLWTVSIAVWHMHTVSVFSLSTLSEAEIYFQTKTKWMLNHTVSALTDWWQQVGRALYQSLADE